MIYLQRGLHMSSFNDLLIITIKTRDKENFCTAMLLTFYKTLPFIKQNSVALIRKRIILIERPPLVREVSAIFCG
jgi:hypothetical protein